MIFKYWAVYFALCFGLSTISAQNPIWKDIVLEETNIKALQTDTVGFIWGLSDKGLFKYDGSNLTQKFSVQNDAISLNTFSIDHNHNFLVGTNSGSIIKYNPYTGVTFDIKVIRENSPITYLDCNDSNNACLILSYGMGINWTTSNIDTFLTTENLLISNEVYSAVLDQDIAVLATDQGLQILQEKQGEITSKILNQNNGLGDVIITNVIKENGYYWASNFDSQIYKIDVSSYDVSIINLPNRSKINGIKFIKPSLLAVYSDEGILFYENNIWTKKFPIQGSQKVVDISLDEENNLWICDNSTTLARANLGFELLPTMVDKAHAIVDVGNSFWIGSPDGLFIEEDNQKRKILDKIITCLKMINDDVLVGTFSSGIYILNNKGEIIKNIDGWSNNSNQSVLYLHPINDILYISSLTGVIKMQLSKNNGRYTTSNYQDLNELLGPGYVYQILDKGEDLYFATDRQGIKIIRDNTMQHITHFDNGNTLGSIYSMTKCDADRMWFSSSIGYVGYVFDGEVYNLENERFPQDPYTSLITTSDQKIVMIRNSSIDLYDPVSQHFLYYKDIMQSSEQDLFLNCFTQQENSISLAISNGVVQIGEFKNQKTGPEPLINNVMANLQDVGEKTSFDEDQNNLEFKYSAAWMTDPERVVYQYKLEGLEESWRTTRDESAIYPMLRSGKYTFRLKCSLDGMFAQSNEKSYAFTIKQKFYKSWWFILLMILLIGGVIRKWRYEKKKVRLQKESLNKKRIEAQLISLQTQLNPHFLFNSFNTLIGLIEEDPSKGITFTEKLTDFYRDILTIGKNDLIPLNDELKLLNTYIHLIKERFGDQLIIELNIDDPYSYHIPPLTLQLLIENAVKHNVVSSKKPLIVSLLQSKSTIIVKNKICPKYGDSTGTGIGLNNIRKRHTLNNLRPPHIEQNDTYFIVTIYLNKSKK